MSIEKYNAAVSYRKIGLLNHPLSAPTDNKNSPGKRPLLAGWQNIESVSEENLKTWFLNTDNNIGVQCGKRSGVTLIDNDGSPFMNYLFPNGIPGTKQSYRTAGRGHIYFKYTPDIKAQKHHELGIEILSDGSNAVMPPSVHATGDVYKWVDPDAPILDMPEELIKKLEYLFRLESELNIALSKCRKCFRSILKNKPNFHGAEGRELMIAVCADLLAKDLTHEHIQLFAKLVYGKDYDAKTTDAELKHIDNSKTWKCETLKAKFPGFINPDECEKCEKRREEYKAFKEGRKKPAIKEPLELPPIPHEPIDPTPISIQEVTAEFKKDIHVDEDINITLPFDFAICNFSPCDSDVFGIVAPSGSGKTEEIRALGDTENQYIFPVSSITSHTFVSGLKESRDLAPQLRGRLITVKDFTTILSKNKDEVSGIFADLRDITDGYIQKTYGSEVGKKEYRGIHTSVLFACTNAIEKYYSVNGILGQRLIYFRPKTDPRQARIKAMQNAGKEKEIRDRHHALVMRLMNTILTAKKERIRTLTQNVPADMQERIGKLCEFLAIVRTHIDRDLRGDMASIPEPELPTRLTKSLCKLVDGHSILYDRLPTYQDEAIALRLINDNIPTERLQILKILSCFDEYKTTSEIATASKLPTPMVNRVLNDLASLEVIERIDRETSGARGDTWKLPEAEFKTAFLVATRYKILSSDSERLRGVIRYGVYDSELLDTLSYVYRNEYKEDNEKYFNKVLEAFRIYLTDSHPADNQDAEVQSTTQKVDFCGLCGKPLNGNSEKVGLGLGDVHPSCKFTPIKIRALVNVPVFTAINNNVYTLKTGEIKDIPAINAYALIAKKAAEELRVVAT